MQTTTQKQQSIRFGSVLMKVNNVDFGLLDNAKLLINWLVSELKAHNWRIPPKKKPGDVELSAEIYEVFLDNIDAIDGHGVLTSAAGTLVTVTAEAKGTGWTVGKPIKLANKNAANTIVWSIVVKAAGSALTLTTNYVTYVADGTNGDKGYTYIVPVTASAAVITADYTYTPHASKTYTISDVVKLVTFYEVEFINTDENGKVFRITLPKAYTGGNFEFGFASDDAIDEVMKLPLTMKAYPDDDGTMVQIYDEQSPN